MCGVCNAGTLMWWSTRECGSECKWWAGPWSPPTTSAPRTTSAASWSQLRGHHTGHIGHPPLDIGHKVASGADVANT